MPPRHNLPLYILVCLLLAGLIFALEYYRGTSHVALAQELDLQLGIWGSLLVPLLQKISPDITEGIGAYFHARNAWHWERLSALLYAFPGAIIALPLLLLSLVMILVRALRRRSDRNTDAQKDQSGDKDRKDDDLPH